MLPVLVFAGNAVKNFNMKKIIRLFVSILICQLVGLAGSTVTVPAISSWYLTLKKAPFNPPNWVFAPAWTLLFLLMGIALFLIWNKGLKKKNVAVALAYFAVQLSLNFLWSFFFFGLHSPFFAFIDIVLLWIFIFLTIQKFAKISKTASYLLVPYLLWVSFASVLNFFVWRLN